MFTTAAFSGLSKLCAWSRWRGHDGKIFVPIGGAIRKCLRRTYVVLRSIRDQVFRTQISERKGVIHSFLSS